MEEWRAGGQPGVGPPLLEAVVLEVEESSAIFAVVVVGGLEELFEVVVGLNLAVRGFPCGNVGGEEDILLQVWDVVGVVFGGVEVGVAALLVGHEGVGDAFAAAPFGGDELDGELLEGFEAMGVDEDARLEVGAAMTYGFYGFAIDKGLLVVDFGIGEGEGDVDAEIP